MRLADVFPFVGWVGSYRRSSLRPDLAAGLTMGLMALPQGIAFALIAGLPPAYGLFAATIPAALAALFGASRHMITGPANTMALVVFGALAPLLAANHGPEIVLVLGLLVGLIQLGFGLARLGRMVEFISNAVIVGFSTAASLLIAVGQVGNALGLSLGHGKFFYETLANAALAVVNLDINLYATGLTALTLLVMVLFAKNPLRLPAALWAMAVGMAASWALDLPGKGVQTVGNLTQTWPGLHLPPATMALVQDLMPAAFTIALLGLIQAVSVAKVVALRSRQPVNANQEFIGQGLGNVAGSFLGAMPVTGSFNRSLPNFQYGAQTPVSSLASAATVLGCVLVAGPYVGLLPIPVLAGVLLNNAWRMLDVKEITFHLKATRRDAATLLVTFVASLFLNLSFALFVGIFLSVALYLARSAEARVQNMLPRQPGSKLIPSDEPPCPQAAILRVEGHLFFAAAQTVQQEISAFLDRHPHMPNLILRLHHVDVIDANGIGLLADLDHRLRQRGGRLYLVAAHGEVTEALTASGLGARLGPSAWHASTETALSAAMATFSAARCLACPHAHFAECPLLKAEGGRRVVM